MTANHLISHLQVLFLVAGTAWGLSAGELPRTASQDASFNTLHHPFLRNAESYINNLRGGLGLSPDHTFRATRVTQDNEGNYTIEMEQFYQGLRVLGGRLTLEVPQGDFQLCDTNCVDKSYFSNINLTVQPILTPVDAQRIASQMMGQLQGPVPPLVELVVLPEAPGSEAGRLVYQVTLHGTDASQALQQMIYHIDAQQGTVLGHYDNFNPYPPPPPKPKPPKPKPPTPKPPTPKPPTPKPPQPKPPTPKPPTPKPPQPKPPQPKPPSPKPPKPKPPTPPPTDDPTPDPDNGGGGLGEPDMARAKRSLTYLCSDECAGRLTASDGERKAGNYIAKFFKDQGLAPIKSSGSPTAYHMGWEYNGGMYLPTHPDTPTANAWWMSEDVASRGTAYNIGCIVPGTDPSLKNEYIVVTGHYDHLGKKSDGVYRGADDNASGTVGVMEVAACLKNTKPKRSIIFVNVSGEEKGLLGSAAFVKNGPVSQSAIKGNVNLDMIARNGDGIVHVTPAKTNNKVSTLARDARAIAKNHNLTLSAGIEQYINQSDHASFMKKGIPCLFYNTGTHAELHTTKDTLDKLNYRKMEIVIKMARDLVWKIANDTTAPGFVPKDEWSKWKWHSASGYTPDAPASLLGGPAEE